MRKHMRTLGASGGAEGAEPALHTRQLPWFSQAADWQLSAKRSFANGASAFVKRPKDGGQISLKLDLVTIPLHFNRFQKKKQI